MTAPAIPSVTLCPTCAAHHGDDLGELQPDGTYRCIRGHVYQASQ